MLYLPKSQVVTGLYSNGDLVLKFTNELYYGDYYKTSKGQYFTGKTPSVSPSLELILPSESTTQSDDADIAYNTNGVIYKSIKNIPQGTYFITPQYNPVLPTQQDYQIGEFRRYFVKKTNELLYIEVNKDTYENILNKNTQWLWQDYLAFNIPWSITGDKLTVAKTNKNIVDLSIQRLSLYKFNDYLRNDYTKYYK
jgi:hypothetical protein